MSNLLGPVRQLGYVVGDIDAAMRYWAQTLHIGPFYYRQRAQVLENRFEGQQCELSISFALSYSGNVLVTLIQQRDNSPSTFREFLQQGGAGLHHLGFYSENFERDLQRANEADLQVVQHSVIDAAEGRFAIFRSPRDGSPRPALIALHPGNIGLFDMVRREAQRWDGSGPIRRLED